MCICTHPTGESHVTLSVTEIVFLAATVLLFQQSLALSPFFWVFLLKEVPKEALCFYSWLSPSQVCGYTNANSTFFCSDHIHVILLDSNLRKADSNAYLLQGLLELLQVEIAVSGRAGTNE